MRSHEQNGKCQKTVWSRLEAIWQYDSISSWWYSEARMDRGHPYACGRSDDAYAKHAVDVTLPHTVLAVVKALHFPWYWSNAIGWRMTGYSKSMSDFISSLNNSWSSFFRYGIILGQLLTSQPRSRCSHIHGWSRSWCQHSQSSPATFGDFFQHPGPPRWHFNGPCRLHFTKLWVEIAIEKAIQNHHCTILYKLLAGGLWCESLCVRKLFYSFGAGS